MTSDQIAGTCQMNWTAVSIGGKEVESESEWLQEWRHPSQLEGTFSGQGVSLLCCREPI